MNRNAIIYALWGSNISVIESFLEKNVSCYIISSEIFISKSIRKSLESRGYHIIYFEEIYDNKLDNEKEKSLLSLKKSLLSAKLTNNKARTERCISVANNIITTLYALNYAISHFDVSLCIVNEQYTPLARAIVLFSKNNTITTFYISHGAAWGVNYTVHSTSYADLYFIAGERFSNYYSFIDKINKKYIITGLPSWDTMASVIKSPSNQLLWKDKYVLDSKLPTVVFFTTWVAYFSELYILEKDTLKKGFELILKAKISLKEKIEFNLIIKDRAGAGNNQELLQELCHSIGLDNNEIIYTNGNAADFLLYSDLIISLDSTISAEAIVAGNAPINIPRPMGWYYGPFIGGNDGIINLTEENIVETITTFLTQPEKRQQYIDNLRNNPQYYSPAFEGNATYSVVQVMEGHCVASTDAHIKNYIANQTQPALSYEQVQETDKQYPWIYFIVEVKEHQLDALANTIDSLAQQSNIHWQLIVLSELSCPNPIFSEIDQLHWLEFDALQLQTTALTSVVSELDSSAWLAFITPGMCLTAYFLTHCQRYMALHPEWHYIYSDDATFNQKGDYCKLNYRPDFNLEYLRSKSYLSSFCLVSANALQQLDDFQLAALSYDLIFKVYEHFGTRAIGHIAELLWSKPTLQFDYEPGITVYSDILEQHLQRNVITAPIIFQRSSDSFYIEYPIIGEPEVTIVIYAATHLELLRACVQQIIEKTDYKNYSLLLIPDKSVSVALQNYIKTIRPISVQFVTVSAAMSNTEIYKIALAETSSDYLLFFDMANLITQNDWLNALLAQIQQEQVVIVAPRIIDENHCLKNAGLILGMGENGVVGSAYRGKPMTEPSEFSRTQVVQAVSAVSNECFILNRALYQQLEGFNSVFTETFSLLDVCLQAQTQGFKIIWTPFSTVINNSESVIDTTVDETIFDKWLPQLAHDFTYNRNLSLKTENFQVEQQFPLAWNPDFKDKPKIYAFPFDSRRVGEYRVRAPLSYLSAKGLIESSLANNHNQLIMPSITEMQRLDPDVIWLQNGFFAPINARWQNYVKFSKAFKICGIDDFEQTLLRKYTLSGTPPDSLNNILADHLQYVDRIIVSNKILAETLAPLCDSEILIVPDYLDNAWWKGVKIPEKPMRKKLRIGWTNSTEELGEVDFIVPVLNALKTEVDWVFIGNCLPELNPNIEMISYPQNLANLDLDLALIPQVANKFNETKSNIRLLEYGFMGWPVICSDLASYHDNTPPVMYLANESQLWIDAIQELIKIPDNLIRQGQLLREWVLQHYMLADHIDEWHAAIMPKLNDSFE